MKVVTLVGSTKFKDEFIKANRDETLKGNIVLSVALFGHHEENFVMDSQVKRNLDTLHLRKIDMSDEILVLNKNGYIGVGACDEIGYAWATGKRVRLLEPMDDCDDDE